VTTNIYATSCLHLGGTRRPVDPIEERLKEELSDLQPGQLILLLGDIIDPEPGWEDANNDWWFPDLLPWPWEHRVPTLHWPSSVYAFAGANYPGHPWSHHHDTVTHEEEVRIATRERLLIGNHDSKVCMLASHFPFVSCSYGGLERVMGQAWQDLMDEVKPDCLVFGHLHEPYVDRIPRDINGVPVFLVSDHSKGSPVLHRIRIPSENG
jgi:predicted phosphodiesterase